MRRKFFFQLSVVTGMLSAMLFFSCDQKANKEEPVPAFRNDIQAFKKQDSVSAPTKNAILFIGSSSFTLWQNVQDYFPGHTIINRGFGGSSLTHLIQYAEDIIYPYDPKQIVIYCGENDLAASDTVTGAMVFDRFIELFRLIRKKYNDIPVLYISMKPSPSRRHLFPKMRDGNRMIGDFLANEEKTGFVDVHSKMLNETGEPYSEIFLEDSLHMNVKGYAIWQRAIEPHLLKE